MPYEEYSEDGDFRPSPSRSYEKYNEQDNEARQKVVDRIKGIGILDEINSLKNIVKTGKQIHEARKERIILTRKQYEELWDSLNFINSKLQKSDFIFGSYIRVSKGEPPIDNLKNVITNFFDFIKFERKRTFNKIKLRKTGNYYFVQPDFEMYIETLCSILFRVDGGLDISGDYMLDAASQKRDTGNNMGGYDRFGGMSSMGGGSPYDRYGGGFDRFGGGAYSRMYGNSYDSPYSQNFNRTTQIVTKPKRDLGDGSSD